MEIILIGTIDIQLFKIPLRGQDAKNFHLKVLLTFKDSERLSGGGVLLS